MLAQVIAGRAPPLQPLTIKQVEQMMAHGILMEGAPIELIDGLLVRKDRGTQGGDPTMHHPRHAVCVSRLQELMPQVSSHGCHLRSQLPVALSELRAPEPDAAIVRGTSRDYSTRHPGPLDIHVVIEVADSSLDYDRKTKQRIYSEAGIPTYWIVNLIDNLIEVYEQPDAQAGEYRNRREFGPGETIDLGMPDGAVLHVNVDDIIA
jgi:Uma2 family endonuclease